MNLTRVFAKTVIMADGQSLDTDSMKKCSLVLEDGSVFEVDSA
jgi:hypothetical protein